MQLSYISFSGFCCSHRINTGILFHVSGTTGVKATAWSLGYIHKAISICCYSKIHFDINRYLITEIHWMYYKSAQSGRLVLVSLPAIWRITPEATGLVRSDKPQETQKYQPIRLYSCDRMFSWYHLPVQCIKIIFCLP